MNQLLFQRETGALSHGILARAVTNRALHELELWPWIRFNGGERTPVVRGVGSSRQQAVDELFIHEDLEDDSDNGHTREKDTVWACQAGVNTVDIEPNEHRLMITGGADATIKGWRLDEITPSRKTQIIKSPVEVEKGPSAHKFGITHLTFHPLDTNTFFTSSFDHSLKIYDTEVFGPYGSVELDSIIYSFAVSSTGGGNLVACCTQHPMVRLVDLNSGSSTHSLIGHHGAVISSAWSPRKEHILATGGTDGTVRIWDVRQASRTLRMLDLEDSVGVLGHDGLGTGYHPRHSAKAHRATVNGITWTDDGNHIVTAGHDNAMRVWDAYSGANTLAHFGPTIVNQKLSYKKILTSMVEHTKPGYQLLVLPNEAHIIVAELLEGRILRRLKLPGPSEAVLRNKPGAQRRVAKRVTSLAWRGPGEGFVSTDTGGFVRVWGSGMLEDQGDELDEKPTEDADARKRKRNVLDEVYKDLIGKKVTFG